MAKKMLFCTAIVVLTIIVFILASSQNNNSDPKRDPAIDQPEAKLNIGSGFKVK